MFAGHLGVALAGKVAEPKVPLGILVAASFGVDLLWPILLLLGIERVSVEPGATAFTPLSFDWYPWSHSLLMAVAWGAAAWLVMRALGRGHRAAGIVGAVVVSHWLLDFVVHRPDLPAWPGGPEVGLGLWHSVAGTFLVEGALTLAAVIWYARTFPAHDPLGRFGLVALTAVMVLVWASSPFSPPLPGSDALAVGGLALWIFPLWAWRVEAHRARSRE